MPSASGLSSAWCRAAWFISLLDADEANTVGIHYLRCCVLSTR